MYRRMIDYSLDGYCRDLQVEVVFSEKVKIPESAINKSLMIAMNYLIENLETDDKESAEQALSLSQVKQLTHLKIILTQYRAFEPHYPVKIYPFQCAYKLS